MLPDPHGGGRWHRPDLGALGSPLGWVENLRPLTGSQPLALLPIAFLTTAAAGMVVSLAGRRDLGAAVLARSRPATARTRLLGGATTFVIQLERWVAWPGSPAWPHLP